MGKYGRFNFGSAYSDGNAWTEAVAGQDQAGDEVSDLRRELIALKVALAGRDTALEKAAFDAQRARDQWQRELSNAEQAWKAEEAARLAAAQAQWRAQFASALAEMTVRCEAAELMLERVRRESHYESFRGSDLAKGTNRKIELQQIISAPGTKGEDRTQESNIVIRNNRAWAAQATEQKHRGSRKYDSWIVAAASLGLSAAAAYFGIERYLETLPQLHFGRW
jgi:hypothetical protein